MTSAFVLAVWVALAPPPAPAAATRSVATSAVVREAVILSGIENMYRFGRVIPPR